MNERTTVRLPAELLKRAKLKAAEDGRTLTALIEEGLRQVVADDRKLAKKKRGALPVSKATGGLMPGIDLTQIHEMEDQEYVARMKHFK